MILIGALLSLLFIFLLKCLWKCLKDSVGKARIILEVDSLVSEWWAVAYGLKFSMNFITLVIEQI